MLQRNGKFTSFAGDKGWGLLLIAAVALCVLVNPVGMLGGWSDDARYLVGARCIAENLLCLPQNHWEGRWPVTGLLAIGIAIGGITRTAAQFPFLVASLAALLAVAVAGNKWLGRPHGWQIAILLTLSTAFSRQLLQPTVEAVELLFLALGFLFALTWRDQRDLRYGLASGLMLGLAIQVRETALVGVAAILLLVLRAKPDLRTVAVAGGAFLLPLAIELLVFWYSTGDPLFRRNLSLAHTSIYSTELAHGTSKQSLFNLQNVAAWKLEPGLRLFWPLDPFLNALFNVQNGMVYLFSLLVLLTQHRRLQTDTVASSRSLMVAGLIYASVLIFALAIDPKPRMLLVPQLLFTAALVLCLQELWRLGAKLLVAVIIGVSAATNLHTLFVLVRPAQAEEAVERWASRYPALVEIDRNTKALLVLRRRMQSLPELGSGRPYMIVGFRRVDCSSWTKVKRLNTRIELMEEHSHSRSQFLREKGGVFCLFRYRDPGAAAEVKRILEDSRLRPPAAGS